MSALRIGVCGIIIVGLATAAALTQQKQDTRQVGENAQPAPTNRGLVFPASDLRADLKKLVDRKQSGSIRLMDGGHFRSSVVHREGKEEAQWHLVDTDYYFILDGTATLITGGELINAKDEADGDKRAEGIRGGISQEIGPGDVVFVPSKTPHHTIFHDAKGITYVNTHWPGQWPPKAPTK